ncbi:hypothetical protein [Xanthomonas translucens]|uniref:hypothetical protein n=1 Tax=Xanthomonas campestris pv. translucens TaxID=343 RepID=UPI0012D9776D|nr:hypothetical protein [Xanthomonas translucens]
MKRALGKCTDLTTSIQTTASLPCRTSQRADDFSPPLQLRFMHMAIPPWNVMARNDHDQWTLSGLLDFGDAIVGHCDLFELLTPLIFMAQEQPAAGDGTAGRLRLARRRTAPAPPAHGRRIDQARLRSRRVHAASSGQRTARHMGTYRCADVPAVSRRRR